MTDFKHLLAHWGAYPQRLVSGLIISYREVICRRIWSDNNDEIMAAHGTILID